MGHASAELALGSRAVAAANVSKPVDAKSPKSREALAADTVIGERYRIVKLLGEGATGIVYAAEHILLHKRIALKILHPELTDTPESVARFEREAMATSRIEHPNVAASVDFGKLLDGSMYLALEYVEGQRLRDEILKGPLGVQRSLYIARQIASALAAAQALEIVHRDMKPENVLLVTKGSDTDFVKVLDFGIARVPVDEDSLGGAQVLTKAGAVFGTAEYMPPEQGIGQKVDTRADLYALGVMLFEMVTGVRPYAQRDDLGILAQQITLPVPTFEDRAPGTEAPQALQRLVHRLLAKRPQERLSMAEDVVRAIDAIIAGDAPGSLAPPSNAPEEPLPAFALATQLPGALCAPNLDGAPGDAKPVDGVASQEPAVAIAAAPSASSESPSKRSERAALVVTSVSKTFSQAFQKLTSLVEARRQSLPEPLRARLLRVSSGVIVVAGAVTVLLLVVSFGLLMHRASQSRAAAAASASALAAAQAEAAAASVAAAKPPPIVDADANSVTPEPDSKDPNVMLDQAQKRLLEGKELDSVNIVARVLGKHPDRRNDARVANILFKSAGSIAKGVANTTFSLLEGAMAAPGAEIVYQLSVDRSLPSYVRARAEKWMHTPQFDRAASDALRIAAKLRFAPNCEAKHALLALAGKAGGGAALAYLHELQGESGCGLSGKSDCYTCLRGDSELIDAIKQVEARMKQ